MMIDPVLYSILAFALAALFLTSAAHKLRSIREFTGTLANYRILPDRLARAAAPVVPVAEGAIGLVLLGRAGAGFFGAAILLALYGLAMARNLARGRAAIDCGCLAFTARSVPLQWPMVGRNAALVALALGAAVGERGDRAMLPLDWISIVAALAGGCLLYLAFGEWVAARARGNGRATQ